MLELASSESTVALELSGQLLAAQPAWAAEVPIEQIVSPRSARCGRCAKPPTHISAPAAAHPGEMPKSLGAAVRIVESKWEDTREFGFRMLREEFSSATTRRRSWLASATASSPTQALGRELISRYFQSESGPEYLLKLSEHPSTDLQLFATNYLERPTPARRSSGCGRCDTTS